MTNRSYELFFHPFNEVDFLTGANVLDVAKIGIDGALLDRNITQITDAYRRIHEEVVVQQAIKADGIRPDGSFGMFHLNSRFTSSFFHSRSTWWRSLQRKLRYV
jgi:hypothetical protein